MAMQARNMYAADIDRTVFKKSPEIGPDDEVFKQRRDLKKTAY